MNVCILLMLLLPVLSLQNEDPTTFKVLWNVPTVQCSKPQSTDFASLLKPYGISVNEGDRFKGDVVTIFYERELGLYPYLNDTDFPVNGGIPQLGNLSAHLGKARADIENATPNELFNGLGVIDWESWRPVWNFNWGMLKKYQDESFELVQKEHPHWKNNSIVKQAKTQWEKSARDFMLKTLKLVQTMRPRGLWCFYLFPDCYNYNGKTPDEFRCPQIVTEGNNELQWLWDQSTAVCPSLYVVDGYLEKYTFEQRTWYVNGRLQEALRVAPNAQLYPYVGYAIKPGTMIPEDDFWRILAQTAVAGSSGAVIWGASATVNSKANCQLLENYVNDTLGPAVKTVQDNAKRCAQTVCNRKGRCTWPHDPNVQAWKFYTDTNKHPFNKDHITCKCVKGYAGRYCNTTKRATTEDLFHRNYMLRNNVWKKT